MGTFLLAGSAPGAALATDSPPTDLSGYTAHLATSRPSVYRRWREILPVQFAGTRWLSRFEGVTAPTRTVAVGGATMIFGSACKPHDCGDNQVALLASPDGSRVVAVVHLSTGTRMRNGTWTTDRAVLILGSPSDVELSCLKTVDADKEARVQSC